MNYEDRLYGWLCMAGISLVVAAIYAEFASVVFHSGVVLARLKEIDPLDDVSRDTIGSYLWTLARDKEIACVERGAGRRPALYMNMRKAKAA